MGVSALPQPPLMRASHRTVAGGHSRIGQRTVARLQENLQPKRQPVLPGSGTERNKLRRHVRLYPVAAQAQPPTSAIR